MSGLPDNDQELGFPIKVIWEEDFKREVEYPNGVRAPEEWVGDEDGEWRFLYDWCGNRIYLNDDGTEPE